MNRDLGVWTAEDSALVLIDYQRDQFESIRSETPADLIELNTRWLIRAAKAFAVPIVLSTIGVDLVTFTALQVMQVGSINYTPLFALPVLMGAVLGTSAVGLGTTAAATLLLLAHATWFWLEQPADTSPRFVQAALTGTGLFVVALLAHELARRLTREEAVAQPAKASV